MKKISKWLALSLAICMAVPNIAGAAPAMEAYAQESEENLLKAGSVSVSEETLTKGQPFAANTADSAKFRIPALITLDNGDLVAAADARWTGGADWGGLDTIASVSSDNGKTWNYSFPIFFPDSNTIYPGYQVATTAIDPILVQGNDGTIYCIADMNPSGITTGDIMPGYGTGYVEIDGQWRLALTGTYTRPNKNDLSTYGDPADYEYYVGDFDEEGFAPVLRQDDHSATEWGVDEWYNIYTVNETTGAYEATLTQTMVNDTTVIQQNAFYKDSVLHVYNTGYIWMVTSKDNGRTWGDPTILNTQIKRDSDRALLVSPGQGMVASNGDIIIPFYDHGDGTENASIIWSSDNGKTWTRSNDVSGMWSSESEVVEINNGVLRMFFRNGLGRVCYADITNTDGTWTMGAGVQTSIPVCSTCNVTAIRHSEMIDGKLAVMVGCPGGSARERGRIFTFLVDEDNSMELYNTYAVNEGYYAYSCMTELNNGNIGLLWEDQGTNIRYDEIELDVVLGLKKNVVVNPGESYVEETPGTEEKVITKAPNEKVATVTSELITESEEYVLHDHVSNTGSSLSSFSAAAGNAVLSEAEFTFTASGTNWKIYNESTNTYLTNAAYVDTFFSAAAGDMQVTKVDGGFRICKANGQRYVIFFYNEMNFNSNSAYNANFTTGTYNLTLLEKQDAVSADDVIPGYKIATEVKNGSKYLICHLWGAGTASEADDAVIVLHPTNGKNNQTKMVGAKDSLAKNVLTITGVAPGNTTAEVDGIIYDITVLDPSLSPTYAGNDLPTAGMSLSAGSTEKTEGPLSALFDGDETTFYHSNWSDKSNIPTAEDFWIIVTLPEVTEISGMRYLPRQSSPNGRILSYEISYSLDAENWTVAAVGDWADDGSWKIARFEDNVEAKFVKIFAVDSKADNNGRHLTGAELRVLKAVEKPDVPEKEVCEIFTDVEHGAWYESAVQYVYDREIILGNGNEFSPNNATSRAMVAMILYRLEGSPEVTDYTKYNKFTDVEAGAWYADAVAWALNVGLATGDDYNMLYSPDADVTREQLATFLYRYAEFAGRDTAIEGSYDTLFGGTYVNEWAKAGFAWTIENEIIKGAEITDGAGNVSYDLNPQGGATRAQFATVVQRFLEGAE